ncbi:hypothetical protein F5884DRAFT_861704 [Xylogone sp. PMI_703]|nr:hypothetical protein F5884DRAFT_861704 [Xylogone sp. PMI_703]
MRQIVCLTSINSTSCRLRHAKCDEIQPTCGRCKRLEIVCEFSDFIVPSNWCSLSSKTAAPREELQPASTWEVFNIPITAVPSPASLDNALFNSEGVLDIDPEKAHLLQHYQKGIGAWMDLFDHSMCYQRDVMRRAHTSPLIMTALCALTAKQLCLVRREEAWDAVAVRYYGESLHHLINVLGSTQPCVEDALFGTILLSSYELLASPGLDHRRHVAGSLTLIKTHNVTARSKRLARASFWIYARHDTCMGLINECPAMLQPKDWNVSWAKQESEEDTLGNQMIWLLAKVMAFTFGNAENKSEETLLVIRTQLLAELKAWLNGLPPSFKGVPYGPLSREGFVKRWFAVPLSAAAMYTYHLAMLLLLAEGVNPSLLQNENFRDGIQKHATSIGEIALSDITDAVLVQAVQPLYFGKESLFSLLDLGSLWIAAKHIEGIGKKSKLWALMEHIETNLGFHTSGRIAKLQSLTETH